MHGLESLSNFFGCAVHGLGCLSSILDVQCMDLDLDLDWNCLTCEILELTKVKLIQVTNWGMSILVLT